MTWHGDPKDSPDGRQLLTVAHRAANDVATLSAALSANVDLVEADVRFFKGTPEIRHTKTLGSKLLWEPGELIRREGLAIPTLTEVLTSLPNDRHRLMLDLKGFRPGLGPAVAAVLKQHAPDLPVTVCTPHWWMFKAFADTPHIRTVLSAGSWPMVERLRALLNKGQAEWPNQRPIFGCSVHRTLLTPEIVAELRRHVEHVITWPVDTANDVADARRLGVTGVTGKDLALLQSLHSNH
ncbi:glycerophosphodiester phosphodiesterase [Phytoactinopolyspora endophytica]|uniref:glycerophosphodiester phosphodiesterase n=1 Tax=Phytoactinopolyspora endophytica TaxID=1642495 RepID=UPI00197C7FA6|nr:glycerophosphodiester phosphodiesterase [Phytoactinopolyspora endophytica]